MNKNNYGLSSNIFKVIVLLNFCFLIGIDELVTNFLIKSLRSEGLIIFGALFLVQLIAAPFQAGISDTWCRKRTLMASMVITAISCAFIVFFIGGLNYTPLLIAAALKFSCGNMLPICRAGIVDFFIGKGFRFVIGISTFSIATGYLAVENVNLIPLVLFSVGLIIAILISLIFISVLLKDSADEIEVDNVVKNKSILQKIKIEQTEIINSFLKVKKFLKTLGSYMIWELVFYSIFLLSIDLNYFPKMTSVLMILGYIIGISILPILTRVKNSKLILTGIFISITALILLILNNLFENRWNSDGIKAFAQIIFSLGYGFIVPCLFSLLTDRYKDVHLQGKLYGLIESGDNISFMIAFFIGKVYIHYSTSELTVSIIALVLFLFGVILYSKLGGGDEHDGKEII